MLFMLQSSWRALVMVMVCEILILSACGVCRSACWACPPMQHAVPQGWVVLFLVL